MVKQLITSGKSWRLGSLIALTVLLGLQLLRTFLPLLLYVLRDRFGWSAVQIGLLAIGLFGLTFLAAPLARWLGAHRLLVMTLCLILGARLFIQWWRGDPLWGLIASMVGVLAFGLVLPLLAGWAAGSAQLTPAAALGVLGGLALDLGLYGLYNTYDLSWRTDGVTAVFVSFLALVVLLLLFFSLRTFPTAPTDPSHGTLAWLALGPLLFFYLLNTGNLAALQALSGWPSALALLLLLLAHLLGLSLFFWPAGLARGATLAGAALLLVWLAGVAFGGWAIGGEGTAVIILLTQPILAGLWLLGLGGWQPGIGPARLRGLSATNGAALLLLAILLFAYYASYDIRLPFGQEVLPAVALGLMLAATLPGWRWKAVTETAVWRPWAAAFAVLLIFPLVLWVNGRQSEPTVTAVRPLRVMTYNLHNGFNPQGNLDLETLARTIEREQVDVVGLQEVSRGWVVNGSVDMLVWLAQRLGMNYVFAPTTGPLWGNALLTRLPVVSSQEFSLPPDDLLLSRGVLEVVVALEDGQTLTTLTTHYHHLEADSDIRVLQSQAIVDRWPAPTAVVLMGDLNATPDSPEMNLLGAAGWQDALAVNGVTSNFTYPAIGPTRQIDYIWVSPDLGVGETAVLPDTGSDHLPIVATLE